MSPSNVGILTAVQGTVYVISGMNIDESSLSLNCSQTDELNEWQK
jgi:hypothetical protein